MRPEIFEIDKLCEYLQGTYHTLQEGIHTFYPEMSEEELTKEEHEQIDQEIFCCETCSWWHEANEQDSDGNCSDCHDDSNDEDEEE